VGKSKSNRDKGAPRKIVEEDEDFDWRKALEKEEQDKFDYERKLAEIEKNEIQTTMKIINYDKFEDIPKELI